MNISFWIPFIPGILCLIKAYFAFPLSDSFTLGITRSFKKVKSEWSKKEEEELQDLEFRNSISNFWLSIAVGLLFVAGILAILDPA